MKEQIIHRGKAKQEVLKELWKKHEEGEEE